MSEILNSHNVRTRKQHTCFGCGREFEKGTIMRRECIVDGGTAFTCYLCQTCYGISCDMYSGDEFGFSELKETALEVERERVLKE